MKKWPKLGDRSIAAISLAKNAGRPVDAERMKKDLEECYKAPAAKVDKGFEQMIVNREGNKLIKSLAK